MRTAWAMVRMLARQRAIRAFARARANTGSSSVESAPMMASARRSSPTESHLSCPRPGKAQPPSHLPASPALLSANGRAGPSPPPSLHPFAGTRIVPRGGRGGQRCQEVSRVPRIPAGGGPLVVLPGIGGPKRELPSRGRSHTGQGRDTVWRWSLASRLRRSLASRQHQATLLATPSRLRRELAGDAVAPEAQPHYNGTLLRQLATEAAKGSSA